MSVPATEVIIQEIQAEANSFYALKGELTLIEDGADPSPHIFAGAADAVMIVE